jgi:hypothetical protein
MGMESLWDMLPAELQQQIYYMRWQAAVACLNRELLLQVEPAVPTSSGTMLERTERGFWYRSPKFQLPNSTLHWGLWCDNLPRVAVTTKYCCSPNWYRNMIHLPVFFYDLSKCELGPEAVPISSST